MIKHLSLLLGILVLCLTGCVPPPRPSVTISKQARLERLQQMQVWQAEGRVAIKDKQQAQTASYKWQQNNQNYHVYFYSPFSNQSLTVCGNATEVKIESAHGMNADEIKLEQNLPLAQLGYWAKGMAAPYSQPQLQVYDSCNQLQKLQQDGWTVEYQSYSTVKSIALPEKIALHNGTVHVKLTIKRWNHAQ